MKNMWKKTGKLKAICVLLILTMLLGLVPGAAWAEAGAEQAASEELGTADKPYLIGTADDLVDFRDKVNGGEKDACARLTADIALSGAWTPIYPNSGYITEAYAGNFDGAGYTISGLLINTTDSYQGLFGAINGATIQNLNVEGNVTSSNNYVGGLVGKVQQGTIKHCSFSGSVTTTKSGGYVGGLVGYAGNSATQTATISGCVNNGAVTGGTSGGLVGYAKYTTIESCYNTGAVQGTSRSGGIAGQLQNNCTASHCYHLGEISGSKTASGICDFLYSSSKLEHCYSDGNIFGAGTGTATDCGALGTAEALLEKLGDGFTADVDGINGGWPVLAWQAGGDAPTPPVPEEPAVSIQSANGNTLWAEAGDNHVTEMTLTAIYQNMDSSTPSLLGWSIDNEKAASGEVADNDETCYQVTAEQGGIATVTVQVLYQDTVYTATYEIVVIPYFTTVEIQNAADAYPGNIAVGQTVKAVVHLQGGSVFRPEDYPGLELQYQWYYRPGGGSSVPIAGATDNVYTISEDFHEWDYVGVEVMCNQKVVHNHADHQKYVRSADYGVLYPVAYDQSFPLPTEVKDDTLVLPTSHTVGDITADIQWGSYENETYKECSAEALKELLTRPETGTRTVKIGAHFTYGEAFANRGFPLTLYADGAQNPAESELQAAMKALGDDYKLYPAYGTDTNVNDMVQAALAEKGCADVRVSVQSVEEVYGGAGLGADGTITYFYADPNTTPAIKMGSYKVTFCLSKGEEAAELKDIPVIVYWDVEKVKATMRQEILDKVDMDTTVPVDKDFPLPKTVDGKTWTLISWSSSDDSVISISNQNQGTADTLFDPYVAVVKQGETEQTVTLTATFHFQLTNDVIGSEKPITMVKVFSVTVPALGDSEQARIQAALLEKLEQGFSAKGLTDVVTGQPLLAEDGVYTASNDIQFPTTRDFGVDGKYYPVTITSSNPAVVKAPQVRNAARVEVYRPGVGEAEQAAEVTVTLHDKDTSVTASKVFNIKVQALTQGEIDAELALMDKVKASYFDGIKGGNTAKNDVRTDLSPFQEVYQQDGQLIWVRTAKDRVGHGIVPTPIEGWEDRELWRLFKSSNPNVISHETLLVARQAEAKAVTVTSYLSSETLGRYGKLYLEEPEQYPQYAQLAALYYQEVSTDAVAQPARSRAARYSSDTMIVRGTKNPESAVPVEETVDMAFALTGLDGEPWISTTLSDLDETATVYDVFEQILTEQGYSWERQKGTYIVSITTPDGETLRESQFGDRSGWMYRVNGVIPDVYMGACPLHNGDKLQVFYTKDASKDDDTWPWPSEGSSGGGGGTANTVAANQQAKEETAGQTAQVVRNEADGIYTVTMPADNQGAQMVTIPAGKAGQLIVAAYADGTEQVVKKAIVENGTAKLLLERDVTLRFVDYTNRYSDVAAGAWYRSAVDFAAGRKILSGVSKQEFAPDQTLSRAMAVTALYRLEEPEAVAIRKQFTDVKETAWYAQSVMWAVNAGIAGGYGNGKFAPEADITREQFAAMLYRYAKSTCLNGKDEKENENKNEKTEALRVTGVETLNKFSDANAVSDWASEAMVWAVDNGIISGLPDGTLNPSGTATRAEAAAMLQRFVGVLLQQSEKEDSK